MPREGRGSWGCRGTTSLAPELGRPGVSGHREGCWGCTLSLGDRTNSPIRKRGCRQDRCWGPTAEDGWTSRRGRGRAGGWERTQAGDSVLSSGASGVGRRRWGRGGVGGAGGPELGVGIKSCGPGRRPGGLVRKEETPRPGPGVQPERGDGPGSPAAPRRFQAGPELPSPCVRPSPASRLSRPPPRVSGGARAGGRAGRHVCAARGPVGPAAGEGRAPPGPASGLALRRAGGRTGDGAPARRVPPPMSSSPPARRGFYRQEVTKTAWEVRVVYQDLQPVGSGAYGAVW